MEIVKQKNSSSTLTVILSDEVCGKTASDSAVYRHTLSHHSRHRRSSGRMSGEKSSNSRLFQHLLHPSTYRAGGYVLKRSYQAYEKTLAIFLVAAGIRQRLVNSQEIDLAHELIVKLLIRNSLQYSTVSFWEVLA
ncbi:hypothetical protein OUZ56_029849 [Daphnia magna]|uniref:Uncharacterized protein n=1 Tax=Daphnia magna TaxID=35525 RepID=A0ABR0B834_9CRUS|nr:hypothetical protein OUZ56_029849 [Daphnia magna]